MMQMPDETQAEVLETIHKLLRAWTQPGMDALGWFLEFVGEDFSGLGTGRGEYYGDREALRAMTEREQEQMAGPVTFQVPWMNVRLLSPALALAEGEVRVEVHAPSGVHVVDTRCSLVLERRDERWVLIHFHFSMPDAMQEEGGTLMDTLEAKNRELERQVAERTAELHRSLANLRAAQSQLVQQEKMASLGALTAGIAHEIKNPLNFVNNFAALSRELLDELAEELQDEEGMQAGRADVEEIRALLADVRSNAERIETHGRRADGIVRSMLDHSRSSSGDRRSVDLNGLVSEYVDLAWHAKRAQQADFNVDVLQEPGPDVGTIEVVPQEIGRVVLNLLVNALEAVGERAAAETGTDYEPMVRVITRRVDGEVEIRVADNGPGVAAEMREKVFEPFFTTKPTGSGTGLGLSLSYDIVAQGHGGRLQVEDADGGGALFVVTLPAGVRERDA